MKETKGNEGIVHFEGLAHVRRRPGMYVGDFKRNTYSSAAMNLLREVVGNSVDEFMNGHATEIRVVLDLQLNTISVRDNGRGIPHQFNPDLGISNLEACVGLTNTGGKYDKGDEHAFKFAIGMNGIGLKATTALSTRFKAISQRDGERVEIDYIKGEKDMESRVDSVYEAENYTEIMWQPDDTVITDPLYKYTFIRTYLREVAFLNAGVKIQFLTYRGELKEKDETYHEPEGITAFLKELIGEKEVLTSMPTFEYAENGIRYEIALSVMDQAGEEIYPFVNGNAIEQSSTPVVALRQTYALAMKKFIEEYAVLATKDKKVDINTGDIRSGMMAVIKTLHIDPAFHAQTKTKLINTDIASLMKTTLPDRFLAFFLANQAETKNIIDQILVQARARKAAENARANSLQKNKKRNKSNVSLDIYTPPLKEDAVDKNSIYMFEGRSASGALISAAKNRNPDTGALYKDHVGVLALKGMVLQSLEMPLNKALKNTELATLVDVSGLNRNDPSDLSGLLFDKFIAAVDEDHGGMQIFVLLTIFFATHFPEVVKQGKFLKVMTPLYEIVDKKTQAIHFIYADEDKDQRLEEFGYDPEQVNKKFTLKRNKGLGEMSERCNLTLVENPRLVPIQPKDITELMQLLTVFSGKKNVSDRKNLIFTMGLTEE